MQAYIKFVIGVENFSQFKKIISFKQDRKKLFLV